MIQRGASRGITRTTAVAFGAALAALLLIALFPIFPRQFSVRVGDTASRTLRAPRALSFVSASQTAADKKQAEDAVPPTYVYDPSIRTAQLAEYDKTVAQIDEIRTENADYQHKNDALARLQLSPRSIDTAIGLSDERWQAVAAEGRRVLSQVLNASIDDASVAATKDSVDSQIAPQFIADEALLAAELVRPLIVSTQKVDPDKTQQAKAAASAAIPPHVVSVEKDETILQPGKPVDALTVEKLKEEGLLSNRIVIRNVIAVAIVSAVIAACLAAYLVVLRPRGIDSERHLLALALVVALPLLVAKFYLPLVLPDESRHFLAFMLPVAVAPILIAALLETDVAVVVSLVIGALIAFVSAFLPDISLVASVGPLDSMRLMLVYGVAPLVGVFLVHRADRLNRFLTAGLATGAASGALLVATWLIDGDRTNVDLAWIAFACGMNGAVAGVLAAGVFVTLGVLFGVTTRIQLMELSQLNAPLLRRLQDEAPGTFHHSIIVGNLAERAADLIGADALLTRVGCYYHDIGKVMQPGMYIENIAGAESPHDGMSPEESASVIQQHVLGGVELARRQRLPARVQAFIPEHHGTRLVAFFYRKAAEKNPEVDPALYQYPGPKPQSRETAIVMLADSTEAVIRASEDRSTERINELVDEVIAERVAEGQLDESDLTLRDLRTIAESFKTTMRAVYHPRVKYPEPTPMEARRRVLRLPMRTLGGQRVDVPDPRRRKLD